MKTLLITALLTATYCIPAQSNDPIARYEAVESWRTVDDESAPYLFGVIHSVQVDSKGRLFVLDQQLQELHRFSADGEYEARVCRPGEGPGELSNTFSFTIDPEDRLALQRTFPPGIEIVDGDGTFLESISLEDADGEAPFTFLGSGLVVTREGIVAEGMVMDFTDPKSDRSRVVTSFDRRGKLVAEIARGIQPSVDFQASHVKIDERARFFSAGRRAVSPDGRLFVAPERELYRIDVMDLHGTLLTHIERRVDARPRTAEELEEAERSYAFSREDGRPLPEFEFELEATVPPIGNLQVVADELWVWRDVPDLPDGCLGRVDVFTLDGDFVETREICLPAVEKGDLPRVLDDGRVVVLENLLSASRSANAGSSIKVGNEDVEEDDDEGAAMNVVVYDLVRR